mmetsp:Transcript_41417/g.97041  ORF Transcript_41417/g.97041 Transcript_41417/m.97041 type:complete len:470 (+) Transcript_41417:1594-3003(+)
MLRAPAEGENACPLAARPCWPLPSCRVPLQRHPAGRQRPTRPCGERACVLSFSGCPQHAATAPPCHSSSERGDASLRAAQNQRVDVVRALIGVHDLQVDEVAGDAELVADAIAAEHVAREAGDVQALAAAVALHDGRDLDGRRALVLHAAQAQAALQAEGDLRLHVGQLLLDQLVGRERLAKLLAVQHVLARGVPAVFRGAERAPGDAVAGAVQASERALQAAHLREGVLLGAEHLVHHDLAGDRRAQAHLAVDGRRGQALPALLQHEAADLATVILRPDHEDVGDRAVGDPHLAAGQLIAAVDLAGSGDHRGRVGAVVGLGQAKAADPLAGGQHGQVFTLGGLVAELIDRHHHQGGLHAHHRAVARVHPLHLAGDQAVADVVQAGAAVFGRDGGAQQAQLAHLAEDAGVGLLLAEGLDHPGAQPVAAVGRCGIAHHALFVGQLLVEQQRVVPMKACLAGHGGLLNSCR